MGTNRGVDGLLKARALQGIAGFFVPEKFFRERTPARARLHAGFERNATALSTPLVNG
jgi:hypothetical protein